MAVQKDFTAPCGCEIHIIKWSSKRDIASVKNCPMHKAAPELLEACRRVVEWYENSGTEDPNQESRGSIDLWRECKKVVAAAEGK